MDVSLERDNKSIACEISVTSTGEQEMKNIQKCLAAGYEEVILLSTDQRGLNALHKRATAELEAASFERIRFLLPEEFVSHLEHAAREERMTEKTVGGYRIKVQYKDVGESETRTRKQAISQVIMQAMRRMKKPKE